MDHGEGKGKFHGARKKVGGGGREIPVDAGASVAVIAGAVESGRGLLFWGRNERQQPRRRTQVHKKA